jgi:hypothetical protein
MIQMVKEISIIYSGRKFKALLNIARFLLLFWGWLIHFTFSNLFIYSRQDGARSALFKLVFVLSS